MAYIVDIVIAVIILVSVMLGYRRGLVKTAFGCISLAVAIVLAYFFGSYAGDFIKSTDVYASLSDKATAAISERFDEAEKEGLEKVKESFSGFGSSEIGKTLERLGFEADFLYESYEERMSEGTENAKERFAVEAAGKVMECIANALGVLVTFVLSLIALKILSRICDGIFKLPLLSVINRIGGVLLGLVLGIVTAFALCMAVEILLPCIPENPVLYIGMQGDTVLYNFFVNLNPVIMFLFG